jgi:hypothetical protein
MIQTRASAYTQGGTVSSLAVTVPGGVLNNDLMLTSFVVIANSSTTITPPAGWTLVGSSSISLNRQVIIFSRTSGGSEPGTYTFSFSPTLGYGCDAFMDALYDDGGNTLSVASSSFGTNTSSLPSQPPNTSSNWDGAYACWVDSAIGNSFTLNSVNWALVGYPAGGSAFASGLIPSGTGIAVTPSAGAVPNLSWTNTSSTTRWVWGYLDITGASAPSVDIRCRACDIAQGSTGSVTVSNPSSAGDLMLMFVAESATFVTTINTPSGWTALASDGTNFSFKIFWKLAGGSEPGTYTVTSNGFGAGAMLAMLVAFHSPSGSLQANSSAASSAGAVTSATAPAVTPTNSGDMVVGAYFNHQGTVTMLEAQDWALACNTAGWGAGIVGCGLTLFRSALTTSSIAPAPATLISGSALAWEMGTVDIGLVPISPTSGGNNGLINCC